MLTRIRPATAADVVAISACLAELGYGTPASVVADKLATFAIGSSDAALVADGPTPVMESAIVGVVSVHVMPLFHSAGNIGRITALAVRREARGTGIGRALMQAAEEFAWRSDCRRVEVTSGDHRPDAHAFYEAIGYLLDERRFIKHRIGDPRPR